MTLSTPIVARTARQVLRTFALSDAPDIFALNADREVTRYLRDDEAFATEASHACLAIAFGPLGLASVVARADPANAASIRVVQKVGMRYEGPSEFAGHPAVLYRIRTADYAGAQT